MIRRHGRALLSAIIAVIAAVSAVLYVGAGARNGNLYTVFKGHPAPHDSAIPASAGTWVCAWSASPSGAEPRTGTEGMA